MKLLVSGLMAVAITGTATALNVQPVPTQSLKVEPVTTQSTLKVEPINGMIYNLQTPLKLQGN